MQKDHGAGPVRDEIGPPGTAGIGDRRPHDLEILGAVGVGEDDEVIPVMLHIVLQPDLRVSTSRGVARIGTVQKVDFGGFVIARLDENEGAGLGQAEFDENPESGSS